MQDLDRVIVYLPFWELLTSSPNTWGNSLVSMPSYLTSDKFFYEKCESLITSSSRRHEFQAGQFHESAIYGSNIGV